LDNGTLKFLSQYLINKGERLMSKREKVPVARPASPGQVGEIIARIAPRIDYTSDEVEAITKNKKVGERFNREISATLAKFKFHNVAAAALGVDFERWAGNYQKLFGRRPNLSRLEVPARPEGVGPVRLVVAAVEIVPWTLGRLLQGTLDAMTDHFPIWQCVVDLDGSVTENDRDPHRGTYALWVRDVREADVEFANMSADTLKVDNHPGITLLERLLMEFDYWGERGEHMDQENWTLCSGSRYNNGDVPDAYLRGGEFTINKSHASRVISHLRSRRVWA
jgi:hypothetical protein